jgi:molecular chaperone DnaK (HSP70)
MSWFCFFLLKDEIQQVLLFGGSTRIPRIQNELTKALGGLVLIY